MKLTFLLEGMKRFGGALGRGGGLGRGGAFETGGAGAGGGGGGAAGTGFEDEEDPFVGLEYDGRTGGGFEEVDSSSFRF